MKDIFPGYVKKSKEEIQGILRDGIIIIDANILLNLYGYSKQTKDAIIKLLHKLNDRIWLPHQAALEYNKNRFNVIYKQVGAFNGFDKKIQTIKDSLNSNNEPPFLSEKTNNKLNEILNEVSKEVDEGKNELKGFFEDDPIYNELSILFANKISKSFKDDELEELYKEGRKRYDNKKPPGYRDKDKPGKDAFGDFILWKQMIQKGKETEKPIMFITDDKKDDWWWNLKGGKTLGPRQELVEEIKKESGIDFHMYTSESFLKYGKKFFDDKTYNFASEEIKLNRIRKRKNEMLYEKIQQFHKLKSKKESIVKRIKLIDVKLNFNLEVNEYENHSPEEKKRLYYERSYLTKKLDAIDLKIKNLSTEIDKDYEDDLNFYKHYNKNMILSKYLDN